MALTQLRRKKEATLQGPKLTINKKPAERAIPIKAKRKSETRKAPLHQTLDAVTNRVFSPSEYAQARPKNFAPAMQPLKHRYGRSLRGNERLPSATHLTSILDQQSRQSSMSRNHNASGVSLSSHLARKQRLNESV